MRKIIALLACLWALCAGATNITNYPVRTTFNAAYWFLLSDVTAQTNWNLPGNYVASTTDLNTSSNILWGFTTNVNFTNIYVTNLVVTSNAFFFGTNIFNNLFATNAYFTNLWASNAYFNNGWITNLYTDRAWITNLYANNAWITNLYANNGWITNLYTDKGYITNIFTQQIKYYTNTGTMAPDFAKGYDAISTNASFTFLDPINTESNGKFVETTVKLVENSSGSAIVATPFANCIVISNSYMGVGANGATWFTFVRYGTQKTNVYSNAETH